MDTKHDEALREILKKFYLSIDKVDITSVHLLDRERDIFKRTITQINALHKNDVALYERKIAKIIAHYLKINLHTIMGIKRGYYGGCDKELAQRIAQAAKEIVK